MSKFRSIADEIDGINVEDTLDQTDDPEGPKEAGAESPPAEDDPTADPEEQESPEDEPEEDEGDEPEGEADTPAEPEDEDAEGETEGEDEDDESEPTYLIDGEEVPLSQVLEWRDGRNDLKAAHTKASQRAAELERQLEQVAQQANELTTSQKKLVSDLLDDTNVSKLIRAHPETLKLMIEAPADARKLIGNAQAVSNFWEDYEAVKDNPRLAERLVLSNEGEVDEGEVSEEVLLARQNKVIENVWTGLDSVIEAIAEERGVEDDDLKNEVRKAFLDLAGISAESGREELVAGTQRVMAALLDQNDQGYFIRRGMIDDRFEILESKRSAQKDREEREVEEHNRAVDEQLKDTNDTPKTPSGDGPTSPPPKPPKLKNTRDALDLIDSLDEEMLAAASD